MCLDPRSHGKQLVGKLQVTVDFSLAMPEAVLRRMRPLQQVKTTGMLPIVLLPRKIQECRCQMARSLRCRGCGAQRDSNSIQVTQWIRATQSETSAGSLGSVARHAARGTR